MAEPKAKSITGGPTPEPPLGPKDIARKLKRETRGKPLDKKAKSAASELDREVSGVYEAKQERDAALDAGKDPSTAPPRGDQEPPE